MMKRVNVRLGAAIIATASLTVSNQAIAATPGIIYMESKNSAVTLTPFLTAGDKVGSYVVPGIPDGLGALPAGEGKLKLLTNHEWSATNAVAAGRTTAAGAASGSFISESTYNLKTGEVEKMRDFISDVIWYDYSTGEFGSKPVAPAGALAKDAYGTENHSRLINRFCSATLAPAGLFYDKASGLGYQGAVFLTGEEGGDESRAFAVNMDGEMVQMPRFGLSAWENLKPAQTKGKSTVVLGMEDGSAVDSQLWLYQGTKTKKGQWFEKAGLNNGKLYVLSAGTSIANDNAFRTTYGKNFPVEVTFEKVDWNTNGVEQNNQARTAGMELARVEDGHFDPNKPNDFYFVTTESNKDPKATAPNPETPSVSRDGGALWRLRFVDVNTPSKGATLELLLDGSEQPYLSKPDNIAVDAVGNVLIQEDPGNNALVARIVAYNIKSKKVSVMAQFKSEYFAAGGTSFITQDEESSGIIDVTDLLKTGAKDKARYYMYVAQIHSPTAKARPDLDPTSSWLASAVEGGQWYVMKVQEWNLVYNS
ncbi:MAG: DUF839 domain-containing protein [Candidatus Nanopelagicaceae bacterium]|nr:DUF839 domain-containing protein [Candidatus Nanopelagicaceae bacterium]